MIVHFYELYEVVELLISPPSRNAYGCITAERAMEFHISS